MSKHRLSSIGREAQQKKKEKRRIKMAHEFCLIDGLGVATLDPFDLMGSIKVKLE